MRAKWSLLLVSLVLSLPRTALAAGEFDLDDEPKKAPDAASGKPNDGEVYGTYVPPVATIKPHAYTLSECLALADRNNPNVWAARARLSFVRGQLNEARWTPYWQISSDATFGVIPPLGGTPLYNESPASIRNVPTIPTSGWMPFFQMSVSGGVPLYTFGKITNITKAAEAQVRYNEWDLEKARVDMRMDVRRAFFGLMLARDANYLIDEVLGLLDKNLSTMKDKLRKGDTGVDDVDRLRLELYKDETLARRTEAKKGEIFAIAALRFLTGVQSVFDIPDEPLKRPKKNLAPVVQYLTAARLFRPDVNRARAGVAARAAQVDFARSRYYPDFFLGYRAGYGIAPSAVQQQTAWIGDPFNYYFAGAALGYRWNLDILPNSARVQQAEAQLEEARAFERLALGGIAVEVENAYAQAMDADNREQNWSRAEHRAREWISQTTDHINFGSKDERALIEPLRALVNTRVAHLYALMDLNVTMSELARVTGWDEAAPSD
jgi:multidrug efflux system outer membrane protein